MKKSRFSEELAQLGHALDAREAEWPEAVAAIRLLALTGCRRSEVLNLRWRNIGADAINLRDSKTGPCAVPLVGRHRTTAGYVHLADAHFVEAAETVGEIIAKAMSGSADES